MRERLLKIVHKISLVQIFSEERKTLLLSSFAGGLNRRSLGTPGDRPRQPHCRDPDPIAEFSREDHDSHHSSWLSLLKGYLPTTGDPFASVTMSVSSSFRMFECATFEDRGGERVPINAGIIGLPRIIAMRTRFVWRIRCTSLWKFRENNSFREHVCVQLVVKVWILFYANLCEYALLKLRVIILFCRAWNLLRTG